MSAFHTTGMTVALMGFVLEPLDCLCRVLINPRRACAARVTVLSLSVCVCVCVRVCVCYLANSYAVNAQVQSKIRIECKCATKGF